MNAGGAHLRAAIFSFGGGVLCHLREYLIK